MPIETRFRLPFSRSGHRRRNVRAGTSANTARYLSSVKNREVRVEEQYYIAVDPGAV